MELINNFSEIFLSVWNKGILGVDIFQILIGIGIFLLFLIFRGLISKLVIKSNLIANFNSTCQFSQAEGLGRQAKLAKGFPKGAALWPVKPEACRYPKDGVLGRSSRRLAGFQRTES